MRNLKKLHTEEYTVVVYSKAPSSHFVGEIVSMP